MPRYLTRALGLPLGLALATATTSLAHDGVKDPDVKARMDAMSQIGAQTKVLGQMVKGATAFDTDTARAAAGAIATEAAKIPALFETQADDPASEALPAIWEDWQRFEQLARRLEADAAALAEAANGSLGADSSSTAGSGTGRDPSSPQTAFLRLAKTCNACHTSFRAEKGR